MYERLNNLRYMDTNQQLKSNGVSTHTITWLNLQRITLSEKKPVPKSYILNDPINITFMKWQNYINREQISGCHCLRMGRGMETIKGNMSNFCCFRNVLYPGFISTNVLIMIWYYSFARWYHWGTLGKGVKDIYIYTIFLCVSTNSTLS